MHGPMATGLMPGVTEGDIAERFGSADPVVLDMCACGCGREVDDSGEFYEGADGAVWHEVACVLRTFEVTCHD